VSATVLGIFFVPVFFVLIRSLFKSKQPDGPETPGHGVAAQGGAA